MSVCAVHVCAKMWNCFFFSNRLLPILCILFRMTLAVHGPVRVKILTFLKVNYRCSHLLGLFSSRQNVGFVSLASFVFAPAAWIVFVPSQLYLCLRLSLSICRMSVRGGDLRVGADLAPRPRSTLQRHVLRPLRVRPGKSLLNSTFSPAVWRVYISLGLKVLRMDPTSLHNQKLVCELSKSIKSDKLSDPERQNLN